jgi:hypothetical protein
LRFPPLERHSPPCCPPLRPTPTQPQPRRLNTSTLRRSVTTLAHVPSLWRVGPPAYICPRASEAGGPAWHRSLRRYAQHCQCLSRPPSWCPADMMLPGRHSVKDDVALPPRTIPVAPGVQASRVPAPARGQVAGTRPTARFRTVSPKRLPFRPRSRLGDPWRDHAVLSPPHSSLGGPDVVARGQKSVLASRDLRPPPP